MPRRSGLQAEVCNPVECGLVMSLISKFTRKELGKDIQMFVLLDQVHTAVAYLNCNVVLFIIRAYSFENDYFRRVSVMCRGFSVTSHQVTEFIGSVADRKVHSLFIVLSNYLNVTTFL